MAKAPKTIHVAVNASVLSNLDVMALIAIASRLVSEWDYSLGVHHFPTWVGPNGEAEAMSDREVKLIRMILASLRGDDARPGPHEAEVEVFEDLTDVESPRVIHRAQVIGLSLDARPGPFGGSPEVIEGP
jgi:hypothetical protein